MSDKARIEALLVLIVLFGAVALWTLLPLPAAVKVNDLGYHSTCPFAPWSTLALLLVAGVIWAIRSYFLTQKD